MIRTRPAPSCCSAAVAALLCLAGHVVPAQTPTQAPTQARLARPPMAVDENPDPGIFETVIVAAERELPLVRGQKTRVMTFNGSIPGPTIELLRGDRLVVHFLNLLPEATALHWHGVEVPAVMDGSELSQVPVPRSGYHRYEFTVPTAATYWYHPHHNTNQQLEKGLYGALLVRDPRHDAALTVPAAHDHLVFLDDVKLDEHNQVAPFSTDMTAAFVAWERAEDLANSRLGNHVLVNGRQVAPARPETLPTIEVLAGVPTRLRFLNVANGQLFRLDLSSHEKGWTWYGVGSDQGLWNAAERLRPIDEVINPLGHHKELISNPDTTLGLTLTPADRLEVVVVAAGKPGDELFIDSHDFIKGKHVAYRDPEGNLLFGHDHFDGAGEASHLIRLKVVAPATATAVAASWTPPAALRWDPIEPLPFDRTQEPLPVFLGHMLPDRDTGDAMFFVEVGGADALLQAVRDKKFAMPMDHEPRPMMLLGPKDGHHVRVGETRYWEVINFTGSDHNYHTHGFRFQHVETDYVDLDEPANDRREPARRLAYEDTIRIPKRPNLVMGRSYTIVRLAVRFDDAAHPPGLRRAPAELIAGGLYPGVNRSGGWMLHCHFLEHSAKGMMSFVTVGR